MESDFQREYSISLVDEELSWRKFITLVGALSGESVFINVITQAKKDKPIEDTEDIINDIQSMLSRR